MIVGIYCELETKWVVFYFVLSLFEQDKNAPVLIRKQ